MATNTIRAQEIVKTQATQFATCLRAYQECTTEVQKIVDEMSVIVSDEEATSDEKDMAADVIVEALFPGLGADYLDIHRDILKQKPFVQARKELEAQEDLFATNLERIMKERKLTQEQLAAMTGVSQPAISNVLNRQCRPQQRTVMRFAEALDVDPATLWPPIAPEE